MCGNEKAQKKILSQAPFKISAVTYMELVQGMSYVEKFFHSDSFAMADALIAATCAKYNEPLCTANDKHYKVVSELKLDVFRP